MSDPNPNPPAPVAKKCPSCDATLFPGGKHCPSCGIKTDGTRARSGDVNERLTQLEDRMGPVGRLFDRLKSRGIDPDAIKDEHLDAAKGMLGGSGGASPLGGMLQSLLGPGRMAFGPKTPPTPKP
jgi:hypothetical protein